VPKDLSLGHELAEARVIALGAVVDAQIGARRLVEERAQVRAGEVVEDNVDNGDRKRLALR
jgi:hypothetical protein